MVNAVFCWAMKQPRCPKDSLCTLCNKPTRNTNFIVQTCKSHPSRGMHIICLLDAVANPCPLCHGILYNLSEASKYAYCKHNINKNQCVSITHINGERRI